MTEQQMTAFPADWKESALSDLFFVSSGEGLSQARMRPGPYPVYGGNGITGYHDNYLYADKRLIIGRVGEYCGNVHVTRPQSWVTDNALITTFRDRSAYLPFWFYFLNHLRLNDFAFAAAQPVITGGILNRMKGHFPPPPEQRKIARILTTLDNLIEKTESLIAKYQAIKQGMMHDLFTRGVDAHGRLRPPQSDAPGVYKQSELGWIPQHWEVDLIENVLEWIIDYRGRTPSKTDNGVPLITAKNVRMGFFDHEPREFIGERDFESWMTRGMPVKGDVLFTTEAPLGNVAQITSDDRLAFAQRVIILHTNKRINSAFLKYLLMTDDPQRWIRTKGTGSTVDGIKQTVFRRLPITFPTQTEEQLAIVMRLNSLARQSDMVHQALQKYRLLKTGLLQDLLTGNVRVHMDEAEEVAAHA